MKHRDFIKKLENNGWYFLREGGNHDIYTDGKHIEPVPRHKELKEPLVKKIIKKYGLK